MIIRWIQEQSLPNLKERSVIVMDNASYHSMQIDQVPTMNSRKSEMQEWPSANDIDWSDQMIQAEELRVKYNTDDC